MGALEEYKLKLAAVTPGTLGHLLGAPVRAVQGIGGRILFGRKILNPLDPMKGERLVRVLGGHGKGIVPITEAEFRAIRSGASKGTAYTGMMNGEQIYGKRLYRRGGMVGFAKKHPFITGAGALAAYHMGSNPEARMQMGAALNPPKIYSEKTNAQWGIAPQQPM